MFNLSGTYVKLSTGELLISGGSHGAPWLTVDVNGPENGPNVIGRDMFVMKMYDNFVKPMGAEGTYKPEANGGKCLCGKNYGYDGGSYLAGGQRAGEAASGACCILFI